MKTETSIKFAAGIVVITFIILAMVVFGNKANAQSASAGALAGSQSQAGAAAGAIGIQINAPDNGGGVGTLGADGGAGGIGGLTELLSPDSVGVGIGGNSSASSNSNASPNIVVGSGNVYEAVDISKRVPGVISPALTTGNLCMGSVSGGLGVSGFGGSFGRTYIDNECERRSTANEARANAMPALASEIMCGNEYYFNADKRLADANGIAPTCVQPANEDSSEEVVQWFPTEMMDSTKFVMGER